MKTNFQNPHLAGESFLWQAGPVGVLLCHGYTATTAEVRLLAEALHSQGYTVSGPLLPGHGATPEEMNRCRWQDWAAAVDQTYQELAQRCQRVVLGGESMGGLLSFYWAARRPEVAAVLSYAAALQSTPPHMQWVARLLAPLLKTKLKGRAAAPSPADDYWQGYTVDPLFAALEFFKLQKEVRRCLPLVRQPALIVQGRQDTSVYPQVPGILAAELGSAVKEVHWFEHSGHCVLLDGEWQQVADLTLDFLRRQGIV